MLAKIAAVIAAFGFVSAASAADMPVRTPIYKAPVAALYDWSGFYAGVNAGGVFSKSDVSTQATATGSYFASSSLPAIASAGAGTVDPNGFIGGIQAGYNWQNGAGVFGLEADFNYFGTKGSRTGTGVYPCCGGTFTMNQEVKTDWLFTMRPRIGFAANNWLLYATGGLAVTNLKYSNTFTDNYCSTVGGCGANAVEDGSVSKVKAGWTVGLGAEYALMNTWSVKAEYLYVDFGSISSTATMTACTPACTAPFSNSADLKSHIARLGINKKF